MDSYMTSVREAFEKEARLGSRITRFLSHPISSTIKGTLLQRHAPGLKSFKGAPGRAMQELKSGSDYVTAILGGGIAASPFLVERPV